MFRLALALGCTVRELGLRLSAAELTEWMAFDLIEPFSSGRADQRARGIMEILLAANGAKNIESANLLPTWQPERDEDPEAHWDRVINQLDALADASGGRQAQEG
jgi:hypothetical protein